MLQEHTVINWVSKPPLIRKKRWFMHFDHVFQKPPHMQKYKKNIICFHEDFFAALQILKACICFTLPTHFKTTKDKIHTFASFIKTRRDLGEFFQIISWLCKFTLKKVYLVCEGCSVPAGSWGPLLLWLPIMQQWWGSARLLLYVDAFFWTENQM